MSITLRSLRAFIAVANSGSFTRAADEMHLTQSALSVLIKGLEEDLEIQLFDRHTRQVKLTEAGVQFLPFVQGIFLELTHAVSHMSDLRDKKSGLLRIAAPQLMSCTLIPSALAIFRKSHPDILLQIEDTLPDLLLETITQGKAEIAIGPDLESSSIITKSALFLDRHLLVCHSTHPLASQSEVNWKQIESYRFIAPTRDFKSRFSSNASAPARRIINRKDTVEVSYMTTAFGLVSTGLDLTVCPSYCASLAQAYDLVTRPIKNGHIERDVCLYYLKINSLSPAAKSFVQVIKELIDAKGTSNF